MSKDDATWLRICYVLFAALVAFVAWKAAATLGLQTGWDERYSDWFSLASALVSIVIGVLVTFFLSKDEERHNYFLSAIAELRKVTWPSFIDTRRMTLVVCVVVGIFAVILAVFDAIWAEVLQLLLA